MHDRLNHECPSLLLALFVCVGAAGCGSVGADSPLASSGASSGGTTAVAGGTSVDSTAGGSGVSSGAPGGAGAGGHPNADAGAAGVATAGGVGGGSSGAAGSPGAAGSFGANPACAFAPPAGSPVAAHGQLQVTGGKLVDQGGRSLQLKGVSSYWLNWESKRYAESPGALTYMRDNWKLSVLRAAMGTDASSGYLTSSANQTALQARVDTIVQNALTLGVYVIVDWHTEKAVNQQPQSVAFFSALAAKYGACPNIIYEDYNEPTGVTWAQIKPYHQAVVSAIRAQDADNLIIMGTPNWSQDVDLAAQDPVSGTNLLYTLHFYACSHKQSLRDKGTAALAKGIGLFITEFGATPADGGVSPNNTVCEAETNLWFAWQAQNGISGVAWKLAAGKDSSNLLTSGAPIDGPFPDSDLSQTAAASPGHGQFIVDWLRE